MAIPKKIVITTGPKWIGLGDVLWFIPMMKKLYMQTETKIHLYTQYPQVFKNFPYIEKIYPLDTFNLKNEAGNNFCFAPFPGKQGLEPLWFCSNIKQFIAVKCGMSLLPHEEEIEFFPDEKEQLDLPEKYVFLNPSIRGVDRDIGQKNWQKIVDNLNNADIPVVIEGPKNQTHNLEIKNGINLCSDQTSLSRTWHLINDSVCFVTFDTGMYILSGTTQTQIFLINSYFENYWHKPYRHGSYDYKLKVIDEGNCSEKCIGNLKYYQSVDKTGFWPPYAQKCPLNKNFCCIPSPERISQEVISFWKNKFFYT